MPYHLGDALYRNACLQGQRTECMARQMKVKVLANATSQANSPKVYTYLHSALRGCKDRATLCLVFQWVEREYLLGYWGRDVMLSTPVSFLY